MAMLNNQMVPPNENGIPKWPTANFTQEGP